jgi:hypothetical protein
MGDERPLSGAGKTYFITAGGRGNGEPSLVARNQALAPGSKFSIPTTAKFWCCPHLVI